MKKKIIEHFKIKDPILFSWISRIGKIKKIESAKPDTYFFRLCKEIACQQLSGKAGKVIFGRVQKLFSKNTITPRKVLKIPHQDIRNAGVSHAKARYIRNLAEAVASGDLQFKNFKDMADEEVIAALTQVKGIGRWTAEMFLMFTLAREDVFSFGDLGLKKGLKKVYNFRKDPFKEKIEKIVNNWSPYKTYGCLALWASLELD